MRGEEMVAETKRLKRQITTREAERQITKRDVDKQKQRKKARDKKKVLTPDPAGG
jgi:hypothetical protein